MKNRISFELLHTGKYFVDAIVTSHYQRIVELLQQQLDSFCFCFSFENKLMTRQVATPLMICGYTYFS